MSLFFPFLSPRVQQNISSDSSFFESAGIAELVDIETRTYVKGQRPFTITVVASGGSATPTQLFIQSTPVSFATIQNIQSTDNITLATDNPTLTAGNGIILNKAAAAGQGGGSIDVHNIDLSHFWFIVSATGNVLSVYMEL